MTTTPYGTWPSPLSVDDVTAGALRLATVLIDGTATYWKETDGSGRGVVMRSDGGAITAVTSVFDDGEPVDVTSRVHEYGGPDFAVADGACVFSARRDSRLYLTVDENGTWSAPRAVTPDDGTRYADFVLAGHTLYAVAERHGTAGVVNLLVSVDLISGAARTLREGPDFVANPRVSPSGHALTWYEWDHPSMPWTATRLCAAEVTETGLGEVHHLAGFGTHSAISPAWVTDDELAFVSDESGWWNVYRCSEPLGAARIRPIHPAEAEFAAPPWVFDASLAVLDAEFLVVRWCSYGTWSLGCMRLANGELEEWVTGWEPTAAVACGDGRVAYVGERPDRPSSVVELDLGRGQVRELRASSAISLPDEAISLPEAISWPADGGEAHGFFYPPAHATCVAPDGERPPLLVLVHGGPTSAVTGGYNPGIQFWTTRGFAVLDVNYRGSTGYGREYRRALDGRWGVADIADIAAGVTYLAEQGLVDGARAAIRGGSAGGYAVLRALTATDVFAAGTSRYGIADLTLLATDTHKFEAHYTDSLVGPLPEASEIYRERSPLNHLENLTAPVLLQQGEEDRVVPPNQAIELAEAIRQRGGDVELVMYPGEGHGWRLAETKKDSLEREYAFYARVFGF